MYTQTLAVLKVNGLVETSKQPSVFKLLLIKYVINERRQKLSSSRGEGKESTQKRTAKQMTGVRNITRTKLKFSKTNLHNTSHLQFHFSTLDSVLFLKVKVK